MAELEPGRKFTAYICAYAHADMKAWLKQRAKDESTRRDTLVRDSDVLRWLLRRAMEELPPGAPEPRGRVVGNAMKALISSYVEPETRHWAEKTAKDLGVPLSSIVRWVVADEMDRQTVTTAPDPVPETAIQPARRRRRDIVG